MRKPYPFNFRLIALSTAVVAATTSGCSTTGVNWSSLNPFSSNDAPEVRESSTEQETRVVTAKSPSSATDEVEQAGGFTASAKKAWNSTTSAVTGVFTKSEEKAASEPEVVNDPLSLSNRPDRVNAEVYIANGQLWESTGDFAKAMESYTRALESQPNHTPALASIARLHFRQQNYGEAAKFFQTAASTNPAEASLQNDLGLAHSKLGQTNLAVQHLNKALEISPGNSRYANNLASILYDAGRESEALEVLSNNNKPAVAHFNMAYLYFQSGKLVQARNHLSEVMKYEVMSETDVATRRAVERTKEMLVGLDRSQSMDTGERLAAKPISHQVRTARTEVEDPTATSSTAAGGTSSGGPFSLPQGYKIGDQ